MPHVNPDTSFASRQCRNGIDRVMCWLSSVKRPTDRQERVRARLVRREQRRIQATWSPWVERIRRTGLRETEYAEVMAVYPPSFGRADLPDDVKFLEE